MASLTAGYFTQSARRPITDAMRIGRATTLFATAPLLAGLLALAAPPAADLQADEAFARKSGVCPNAHTEPQDLSADAARHAIRCLLDKRRGGRAGGLGANGKLDNAAQRHTDHMIDRGCFAHECPGEPGMVPRVKATGYLDGVQAWSVGENIAWGEGNLGSPAAIVQAWMDSPGHRANILNRSFEDLGIGFVHGTPDEPHAGGATYTTDFGFNHG
jgi:uncharacterized protein YkwD